MTVSAKMLCWFSSAIPGAWWCWFFIVPGLAVFLVVFASFDRRDFMSIEWKAVGQARIVKNDSVKISDNQSTYQKYTFEWQTPDGRTNQGECFSRYAYQVGSLVPAVCSVKDESLAKLECGTFGTESRVWLVFLPLIYCAFGVIPLFAIIQKGRKVVRLIQFGTHTFAQVRKYVQDGQTYVKAFPVIKFSVVFQASDQTVHSAELFEVRKNMDNIEPELPVIFDPDNPDEFVKSFGMIPKGVTYDSSKNLFRGSFFALLPHYLGLTALIITIVWMFVYFVSLL
jgi:hypothetical protein